MTKSGLRISCVLTLCVIFAGCQPAEKEELVKRPRPVEVKQLRNATIESTSVVSATVASWKTEQIGMEVSGRIVSVVEPNTDIEGHVTDESGKLITQGTPIAQIDDERYQLQKKSAESQVERATLAISAAEIQRDRTLKAQLDAAVAERDRAQTEYNRSKRLVAQKAGAQSDVDRDYAALLTAKSQIDTIKSNIAAQEAELSSLQSQLAQARDSLKEAVRNVNNCVLYSSFRGQISEVSVVPGSFVNTGEPVATIQMMDPIKIEVEVSAEDSRRLRNRQRLPVWVRQEDGTETEMDGFLYLVDPVADGQTRTYTLTLLMLNKRLTEDTSKLKLPTVSQTWRVDFEFLPGASSDKDYVSQNAIYEDESGAWVWCIENMVLHGDTPTDRKLMVRKVRVVRGNEKIPFLGNWVFEDVSFPDNDFQPDRNLIAGRIFFSDPDQDPNQWNGDTLMFQKAGQWMLRPGDLVRVDLSDNVKSSGIFVPMDAIAYDGDKTYLFLLNESGDTPTAERVEIKIVSENHASVMAIESATSDRLEGRKYISRGAHYLLDQDLVRPVESEDGQ